MLIMLNSSAEEYHPRWGARTSNPVKSVNDRLGGFDSCLFRQLALFSFIKLFVCSDSAISSEWRAVAVHAHRLVAAPSGQYAH